MTQHALHSLQGQTLLGRYRVASTLGQGGMGAIDRAFDTRLGRSVVVKVPRAEVLVDPNLRARFLSEVRDLSAHEHPHILGIENSGEHEGVPFAVLQFLGGGDLGSRLDRGLQRPTEVVAWLVPLAAALDFIHDKGCLRRDVKPANIRFDEIQRDAMRDHACCGPRGDARVPQIGCFTARIRRRYGRCEFTTS